MCTRIFARFVLTTFFTVYLSSAYATELAPLTGQALLTVSGNISNHNVDNTAQFDIKMLQSLPATSFITATPWTKGVNEFTGVRLSELLKYVGANSNKFRAFALDNYWIDVTDIDFEKIPAIIAYKKNGRLLRIRELGPLWIIFPFDDFPDTLDEKHMTASVWQLNKIVVN